MPLVNVLLVAHARWQAPMREAPFAATSVTRSDGIAELTLTHAAQIHGLLFDGLSGCCCVTLRMTASGSPPRRG
ncbi:MAG: hypothetical protein ABW321_29905, partial [Polyangiales bacterium]